MRAKKPYQKKRKRIGRGPGSGRGKTSARGQKGGGARSGWRVRWGTEGGQNPYYMRFPKRGFNQPEKKVFDVVNLDALEKLGETNINLNVFKTHRLVKRKHCGVKVLGQGKLTKALVVEAHAFSRTAKESIEKAGGKAITLDETDRKA